MSVSDARIIKAEGDGKFNRQISKFRDTIEVGGKFPPEKGRYHLYVVWGCPWAHRTLIARKLKGLEEIIPITALSPRMDEVGWRFANLDPFPDAELDPLYGASHLKDIYLRASPDYKDRYTVPVLWDKHAETIVNNESSEILRIFNKGFNSILPEKYAKLDLYPEPLRKEIDDMAKWVYPDFNNGVYRAGFAGTQSAHEEAAKAVFAALDRLEAILQKSGSDFIIGKQLTEADIRLFTTMVRFDVGYHGAFKLNYRSIRGNYPKLNSWMKRFYWTEDAFKSTTYFEHIKTGYYSLKSINPNGVVPIGPELPIEPLA